MIKIRKQNVQKHDKSSNDDKRKQFIYSIETCIWNE